MSDLREKILNELSTFQIPVADDTTVFEKATEICTKCFQGDVDNFINDILAFRLNCSVNDNDPLTQEFFHSFERSRSKEETKNQRRKGQYAGATPSTKNGSNRSGKMGRIPKAAAPVFVDYQSKTSDKRIEHSMECDISNDLTNEAESMDYAHVSEHRTPNSSVTSMVISPLGGTPSRLFAERSNSGESVATFGHIEGKEWHCDRNIGQENRVNLVVHCTSSPILESRYYLMNQSLRGMVKALDDRINWLSEIMRNTYPELSTQPADVLSQKENLSYVCGMVFGGDGTERSTRLLPDKIRLRGTTAATSNIAVDISSVSEYSLFPGQVVCFGGMLVAPDKLVAEKVFLGCLPPAVALDLEPEVPDRLSIVIACGPFTLSDGFGYEPLMALFNYLDTHRPHVLVLIAPVLSANREDLLNLPDTYQEFFDRIVSKIVEACNKSSTQLVLVSSAEEATCSPCYPTPPSSADLSEKTQPLFTADPCMLRIGGLVFGITATDVLFQLSPEEISRASKTGTCQDRMKRLIRHCLLQQSFYPLYPPPLDMAMDVESCNVYAKLSMLPHVLILPSNLKPFLKDVDNVVAINPGRLAKGRGGGTFCRFEFDKRKMAQECGNVTSCLRAEILKI